MAQLGGLLGRIHNNKPLIKHVIKPLAKTFLVPLWLTATASTADAGIHKKVLGSGNHSWYSALHNNTILIISNDKMEDIIKIVKSYEDSGFIIKRS